MSRYFKKSLKIFLMLTVVMLSTFLLNASPESLIEIYRVKGIRTVEQHLDKLLFSSAYWEKIISNKNTELGWYETPCFLAVCDGLKKKMLLYSVSNGKTKLIDTFNVVIGKKGIGKVNRGDYKTPLGVYRLMKKKENINGKLYGVLAFVTNYPNKLDISLKKSGNGIWIHGFPVDSLKKEATKGCIALPNNELLKFASETDYKKTLLIIKDGKTIDVNKNEILQIITFIYKWRYFWKYNKISQYLSLYSNDCITSFGNFKKFKRHKIRIFKKMQYKTIDFYNIKITPYPNNLNKKLWRISMFETYDTSAYHFKGEKIIYLINKDGRLKIWREF